MQKEIEKASAAFAKRRPKRAPRGILDSYYLHRPYYRRYSRERYNRQPTRRVWKNKQQRGPTTTREPIFHGQKAFTRRPVFRFFNRNTWRKKNGSIFKGVTRADWDQNYNKPTVDPFGNKVTPRYKKKLQTRPPIFKEEELTSAQQFYQRVYKRFENKYIKPTKAAIFYTDVAVIWKFWVDLVLIFVF